VLKVARHWPLSWARWIQSIPSHPISTRFILILFSHQHLGFPSCLFPPGFPTKILYVFLFSPMPCPSHSPWLDHSNYVSEQHTLWRNSLCSFEQPLIILTMFGPNILLSTLFWNTVSPCSSLHVRDQVSHPYKTTSSLIVLYILIFTVLDNRREAKRFRTEWQKALS
jgi:hypothetical protein